MSFKIDLSASNVAKGITTAIGGITQAKQRQKKAQLANEAKTQENEAAKSKAILEDKTTQLILERQALMVEHERLNLQEKQLELQKKAIEYTLEIAAQTVAVLCPNADEQVKAMLIQALLPTLLQAHNIKGLELILPPESKDE